MEALIINGINVMRVEGEMTKYSNPWRTQTGMVELALLMNKTDTNTDVKAHLFIFNSPGGSLDSLPLISCSIKNAKKPCFAIIEGKCESAAYYVAAMCKKIYAIHEMNEIGSIGVFAELYDDESLMEYFGIKKITIYPKESSQKNLPEREALKGKTDLLEKEKLSPIVDMFCKQVKAYRSQIDSTKEAANVWAGKSYYAKDALKAGLIDGIYTPRECIEMILKEISK